MKNKVTLACTVCQNRNYSTYKSLAISGERLSINKFCKHCGKHTKHTETK